MSDVVISSHEPPIQWSYGGTSFTVRYFYNQNFLDSDNRWVMGGDGQQGFYIEVAGTIDGAGILHIPNSTIISPLGGRQPNTLCSAQLFDENGAGRDFLFTDWTIPQTTPTTFGALEIINEHNTLVNVLGYILTTAQILQVQALINVAVGLLNKASAVIYGLVRLSVSPNSAADPIAVGDNDPRLGSYLNILTYGARATNTEAQNTTAITAAKTAAAITGAGIYIPVGTFPLNSMTIDVPVLCAPGASILRPATGQTVVITGAFQADIGRHFANAATGQGTILFRAAPVTAGGDTQVQFGFVEWWGAVNDYVTDCEPGFTAAIKSGIRRIYLLGGGYGFNRQCFMENNNYAVQGQTGGPYTDIIPLRTDISSVNITAITNANPCVITAVDHRLVSGQTVSIAGAAGTLGAAINGSRVVTVLTADTFSVPVNTSAASVYGGSGATVSGINALFINNVAGSAPLFNAWEGVRFTSFIGFTGTAFNSEAHTLFSSKFLNCWISMGQSAQGFLKGGMSDCFFENLDIENTRIVFRPTTAFSASSFHDCHVLNGVDAFIYSVDVPSNKIQLHHLLASTQKNGFLLYVKNGSDWQIDDVQVDFDGGGTVTGGVAQFDGCTGLQVSNIVGRRVSGNMGGILFNDCQGSASNIQIYDPRVVTETPQAITITGDSDLRVIDPEVYDGTVPHYGISGDGDVEIRSPYSNRSRSCSVITQMPATANITVRDGTLLNANYNTASVVAAMDMSTDGRLTIINNTVGVDDPLADPTGILKFAGGGAAPLFDGNTVLLDSRIALVAAGSTQAFKNGRNYGYATTYYASAMPTTGTWYQGDFVHNQAPPATTNISGITNANPCVVTAPNHGLVTGQSATIAGASSTLGTAINGARIVTVLSANTFSIPVDTSASSVYGGTGATVSTNALLGWVRLTTGSGNVLGTDWAKARGLTGN